MKDSGVEWIGKIPKEWNIKKMSLLADRITDYVASGSFASLKKNVNYLSRPDYAMLIRTVDLSGSSNKQPVYVDKSAYEFLSNSNLFGGELVLSNIGSVGNVYMYTPMYKRATLAPNSIMVNMKGENRFYYYWFLNPIVNETLKLIGSDSVQTKFNKTQLRAFKVVEPPFEEQQKIATFLDEKVSHVDSIIEDTKKSIENLKAYKQSLITETVTKGLDPNVEMKDSGIEWIGEFPFHWERTRIKNMASIGSGSTPKSSNEDYYNGNINWIQSGDLYQKKYIEDTSRKITNKAIKEVSALKFYDAPFITIALYGASIGNVSISKIDSTVNQAVAVIEPNNISIDYLFYLLTASKSGFLSLSVGGTQPNISQTIISNWIVPYPPMDEQNRIVEFLDVKTTQIDNLIDKKEQIITEIEAYKKSLIYEYVTGKKEVK